MGCTDSKLPRMIKSEIPESKINQAIAPKIPTVMSASIALKSINPDEEASFIPEIFPKSTIDRKKKQDEIQNVPIITPKTTRNNEIQSSFKSFNVNIPPVRDNPKLQTNNLNKLRKGLEDNIKPNTHKTLDNNHANEDTRNFSKNVIKLPPILKPNFQNLKPEFDFSFLDVKENEVKIDKFKDKQLIVDKLIEDLNEI